MGIAFIRTIILYIIVVAAVRLMGKRQIGELQPSELVVAILISELAAIPMQETGIPITSGVVPILTLISLEIILSAITVISLKARTIITGKPSILISNGVINQMEMRRLRFTIDDLMEELRLAGIMSIDEVAWAILETNGKLSVFPTEENKPVTAKLMNITPSSGGLPNTIISDGTVSFVTLKNIGKDIMWLKNTLINSNLVPEQVFLMTIDSQDKTLIIPKAK
jgi:uncharacterized membrane protein YcaP (DUF421 family)